MPRSLICVLSKGRPSICQSALLASVTVHSNSVVEFRLVLKDRGDSAAGEEFTNEGQLP